MNVVHTLPIRHVSEHSPHPADTSRDTVPVYKTLMPAVVFGCCTFQSGPSKGTARDTVRVSALRVGTMRYPHWVLYWPTLFPLPVSRASFIRLTFAELFTFSLDGDGGGRVGGGGGRGEGGANQQCDVRCLDMCFRRMWRWQGLRSVRCGEGNCT